MRDVASKLALTALLVAGTVVAMFVGGVQNSFSQVGTSAILGYINDSSGAAVAGTKVTLTNPATGFERVLQSDAAGFFKFADLLPGTFTLLVTQQGFAAFRAEGLVLQVDQQLQQNVTLQPRQITQQTERISATGGAGTEKCPRPRLEIRQPQASVTLREGGRVLPVVSGGTEHREPDWPSHSEEVSNTITLRLGVENGNSF